jgi:hypothetical protein
MVSDDIGKLKPLSKIWGIRKEKIKIYLSRPRMCGLPNAMSMQEESQSRKKPNDMIK